MTDLHPLRAQSDDARAFAARPEDAVVRMHERASLLASPAADDRRGPTTVSKPEVRFACRLALQEDTIVVTLTGELDEAMLETVNETWAQVARFDETRVVVDLSGLEFIDSSGMHALLRLRGELAPSMRLELVRGPECVDRVFALTGLTPLFTFVESVN